MVRTKAFIEIVGTQGENLGEVKLANAWLRDIRKKIGQKIYQDLKVDQDDVMELVQKLLEAVIFIFFFWNG